MQLAPELSGSRHALVLATAAYTDIAFSRLRAPAQDATDIIDVLADPGIGGFTVMPVLDRPEYEIRRAVDDFLHSRAVDDLVLVYLSCHGVEDVRGRLYFAATDTVKARLSSTAVESTWLLDRLEECRARQQVLILDCCFSGSFARTKSDAELDLERRLMGAGRGWAVLTASRAGEYSYEGKPLHGAAPRSVFTAAFVDVLRSGDADRDGDGYISVEDAFVHAADRVKAAEGQQNPQRWLYGAEGEIILARSPRGVVRERNPTISVAENPQAFLTPAHVPRIFNANVPGGRLYRYLRMAMVGLLVTLGIAVFNQTLRQGFLLLSISAYYYTSAQVVFVGTFVGLGAIMLTLRGKVFIENVSLKVGGMAAIAFGVIPPAATEPDWSSLLATKANVQNNIVALLIVGGLCLSASVVFALRERKTLTHEFWWTSGVTAAVYAAAATTYIASIDWFMNEVHFLAAGVLVICIIEVISSRNR